MQIPMQILLVLLEEFTHPTPLRLRQSKNGNKHFIHITDAQSSSQYDDCLYKPDQMKVYGISSGWRAMLNEFCDKTSRTRKEFEAKHPHLFKSGDGNLIKGDFVPEGEEDQDTLDANALHRTDPDIFWDNVEDDKMVKAITNQALR